ncbi:TPA: ABC transporter permease [Enterococcus faecium]
MNFLPIFKRSIKWRFHHKFTIVVTILQPMLWLLLYTQIAKYSMTSIENTNYVTYVFAGLIFLVSFGACSSGGIMNYLMKNDGSFYRVIQSPISRVSLILGQVLESILCSLLEVIIMFLVGLMVGLKIQCSLSGILITLFVVILVNFCIATFAYLMSLIIPNEVMYETTMNAVVLPIFFLSSALFPVDGIKGILGTIVRLNPFTLAIDFIRFILMGKSIIFSNFFITTAIFLLLGILLFWLTLNKIKKSNDY